MEAAPVFDRTQITFSLLNISNDNLFHFDRNYFSFRDGGGRKLCSIFIILKLKSKDCNFRALLEHGFLIFQHCIIVIAIIFVREMGVNRSLAGDVRDVDGKQNKNETQVHAVLFLNIPSYGGGTHPWNRAFSTQGQATDDGLIEVVGLTTYHFVRPTSFPPQLSTVKSLPSSLLL